MKIRVTYWLTFFALVSNFSYGQNEKTVQTPFRQFRLLIINPDGAQIADTLLVWADSIEKKHIARYYSTIENMKSIRKWGDRKARRQTNLQIKAAKSREEDMKDFKYYYVIANSTLFELRTLFNTRYSEEGYSSQQTVLDGFIIDRTDLFSNNFQQLTIDYKVDYIVSFENIYTDRRDGIGTLNYTTSLFSAKDNKMILSKKIEGNAPVDNFKLLSEIFPPGNMHEKGVDCDNYLECMIESAVRFSTEDLFKAIREKQKN